MTTDYPGAISMFVNESRVFIDNNNHQWVVIHKTAGGTSAQAIAQFFASDPNMASTHYVVGQDGTIVQCVWEKDGAAGNCCTSTGHAPYLPTDVNLNWKTVSIEHVDPATDNSTPLTEAQATASFALVKSICSRHNIPMRPGDASGGIIGHCDIDPVNRARCPGNYPWSDLFAYLGEDVSVQITDPVIQQYFNVVNNGTCLQRKDTGVTMGSGITAFYLKYGGPGILRLPDTNEIAVDAQKYPGVVYVEMEACIIIWDPNRLLDNPPSTEGAYLMHTDSGLGQQLLGGALAQKEQALQTALQTIATTAQQALGV